MVLSSGDESAAISSPDGAAPFCLSYPETTSDGMSSCGVDVASKVGPSLEDMPSIASAWWHRNWWAGVVFCGTLLGFIYFDALAYMARVWIEDDNYGHGFFIPFISLLLVWLKRERIQLLQPRGSWWGVPIVLLAVGLYGLGEFGTLYVLLHLSCWLMLVGLCFAAFGKDLLKELAFPLLYLLTMIPLPQFLFQELSGTLQLFSSALGVGCLQVVGITAFRDGNVID